MNKIEKLIVDRAKKILLKTAFDEIVKQRNKIDADKNHTFYIDLFNSGIMVDIDKLKKHGLNILEKEIKKRAKKEVL